MKFKIGDKVIVDCIHVFKHNGDATILDIQCEGITVKYDNDELNEYLVPVNPPTESDRVFSGMTIGKYIINDDELKYIKIAATKTARKIHKNNIRREEDGYLYLKN